VGSKLIKKGILMKLNKTTKILIGAISLSLFCATNVQAKSERICESNEYATDHNCKSCKLHGQVTFIVDKGKGIVLQKTVMEGKKKLSYVKDWTLRGGKCNVINKNNFTCMTRWKHTGNLHETIKMFDGKYIIKTHKFNGRFLHGVCGD